MDPQLAALDSISATFDGTGLTIVSPPVMDLPDGTLCELADRQGPILRVGLRRCGGNAATADRDAREGYHRFPLADGTCRVLEVALIHPVPTALIAHRRTLQPPGWEPDADLAAGRLWLGVPVALIGEAGFRLDMICEAAVESLAIDGVIVDQEWPLQGLRRGAVTLRRHPTCTVTLGRQDLPVAAPERRATLLPFDRPYASYWAPPGHNTWAGDTMVACVDDRIHLFWLHDRHQHHGCWDCGGHGIEHASSADLRTWTRHPSAWPRRRANVAGNGTSCVVHDGAGWWLFSNHCNDRLGPALWGDRPDGVYVARSTDGEIFTEDGGTGIRGEPGIVRDPSGRGYHAVTAGTRWVSDDLRDWTVADDRFLPRPGHAFDPTRDGLTAECYGWFSWGGLHYVYGGRSGFWMARDLLGPYWSSDPTVPILRPRWNIEDGLLVPQICVWRDRALLAGFIGNYAYGGHHVWRELHQEADGTLALRFLEELLPPRGQELAVALTPTVPAGTRRSCNGFAGSWRLQVELVVDASCAAFGLVLGPVGCPSGLELRCEPDAGRVQWGWRSVSAPAPRSEGAPSHGEDFAITRVERLHGRVFLDVLCIDDAKSGNTIVDVCLNRQRTIITRRRHLDHQRLDLFASGGAVSVAGVGAWRLDVAGAR